eukprot:Nk52_evm2s340 gene=Nk52_evmTU2s340
MDPEELKEKEKFVGAPMDDSATDLEAQQAILQESNELDRKEQRKQTMKAPFWMGSSYSSGGGRSREAAGVLNPSPKRPHSGSSSAAASSSSFLRMRSSPESKKKNYSGGGIFDFDASEFRAVRSILGSSVFAEHGRFPVESVNLFASSSPLGDFGKEKQALYIENIESVLGDIEKKLENITVLLRSYTMDSEKSKEDNGVVKKRKRAILQNRFDYFVEIKFVLQWHVNVLTNEKFYKQQPMPFSYEQMDITCMAEFISLTSSSENSERDLFSPAPVMMMGPKDGSSSNGGRAFRDDFKGGSSSTIGNSAHHEYGVEMDSIWFWDAEPPADSTACGTLPNVVGRRGPCEAPFQVNSCTGSFSSSTQVDESGGSGNVGVSQLKETKSVSGTGFQAKGWGIIGESNEYSSMGLFEEDSWQNSFAKARLRMARLRESAVSRKCGILEKLTNLKAKKMATTARFVVFRRYAEGIAQTVLWEPLRLFFSLKFLKLAHLCWLQEVQVDILDKRIAMIDDYLREGVDISFYASNVATWGECLKDSVEGTAVEKDGDQPDGGSVDSRAVKEAIRDDGLPLICPVELLVDLEGLFERNGILQRGLKKLLLIENYVQGRQEILQSIWQNAQSQPTSSRRATKICALIEASPDVSLENHYPYPVDENSTRLDIFHSVVRDNRYEEGLLLERFVKTITLGGESGTEFEVDPENVRAFFNEFTTLLAERYRVQTKLSTLRLYVEKEVMQLLWEPCWIHAGEGGLAERDVYMCERLAEIRRKGVSTLHIEEAYLDPEKNVRIYLPAVSILEDLPYLFSPTDIMLCIAAAVHKASLIAEEVSAKSLTADDIVPILKWCILESYAQNLCQLLSFVHQFADPSLLLGSLGYCFSTFEVTVMHMVNNGKPLFSP